jgi:ABC-type phosphate transport system permease subunit
MLVALALAISETAPMLYTAGWSASSRPDNSPTHQSVT